MLQIKYITLILLIFPSFAFCGAIEDNLLKKTYPSIPKTANSIKILKQATDGDLIQFNEAGDKIIYVNKNGSVIDVTKQISNLFTSEKLLQISITSSNDFCHSVGCVTTYKKGLKTDYYPFFWSQETCKILPNTNQKSNSLCFPKSINNNGLIVGHGYKSCEGVFYLGNKKIEKSFLCIKFVNAVWINQEDVKLIELFEGKDNYSSFLGRGTQLTIDDENFIHFWFDQEGFDYSGSIHLNEIE